MGARLPLSSDWDLDFGDDNVVPIQRAAGRRGTDTQRGIPRVVPPLEPSPASERPLMRIPPGQVREATQARRLHMTPGTLAAARPPGNPWATQEWSPSEAKPTRPEHAGTREWAPSEPQPGTQEWAPTGARASIARTPKFDPQSEATLDVEATSLPRRSAPARRTSHADLDLMSARHEDPCHQSALIVLAEQHAERWQPWLTFAVSAVGAGALLAWFLF